MIAKLYLDVRPNQLRKKGFPIVVSLNVKGQRQFFTLKHYSFAADWDFDLQEPLNDKRLLFYVKKKKLLIEEIQFRAELQGVIDIRAVKNEILGIKIVNDLDFYSFFDAMILEQKRKGKEANSVVYDTAKRQLVKFRSTLNFTAINYNLLNDFKTWQIEKGNKKNTIHHYLRTYRVIYNEAVARNVLEDTRPFKGVFKGITVKSNRTKKRNISKESIVILEQLKDLTAAQQRSVDLWLLLFYFGGQDLIDLYYLKRDQVANNRVYFERGKLDGAGYQFDLQIPDKAKVLIDRYKAASGDYLFGWRKDYDGYNTFRHNFRRSMVQVQKLAAIDVLPLGGNLTIKVARHAFATIGKQLFIETDLLRELMGHERNDVDTIYKDKYPEEMRDEAHLKIIGL